MCGIFGMISTFISDFEKRTVFDLGILNVMRGSDSSGIAVHQTNGVFTSAKSLFVAPEMMLSGTVQRKGDKTPLDIFLGNKEQIRAVIGHCRAATVGKVTVETAHPFHVGKILGVHNGTIKGLVPEKLDEKLQGTKFSCDSFYALSYLNTHSVQETFKYLDEEKNGAFALVWFDTDAKTINFMRNEQRPLHYIDKGSTILWSSSREDLEYIAKKNSFFIKEIKSFEVGHHYSCVLNGESPVLSKIKVKEEKKYSCSSFLPWRGNEEQQSKKEKPEEKISVSVLNASHHKFSQSRLIQVKQMKKFTQDGCCSNCTNTVNFDNTVNWFQFYTGNKEKSNEDFLVNVVMPICNECADDPIVISTYEEYGEMTTSIPINLITAN